MMDYAIIENGVVTNVIYLHPMNANDFPAAVPIGDYTVGVGDTYENGVFYRGGERVRTQQELTQAEMADMKAALANLGVNVDE